jgi:hypothetical protein
MSSMIPLTILSLDTDETVRNLSIEFSDNSAKEICKYPSFSKVGGNYLLDLKIIWSSGSVTHVYSFILKFKSKN